MLQPGIVSMGTDSDSSGLSPWSYNLAVVPGTRTLIASDQEHVVIQRNINAATSIEVNPIDLTGGVATESASLSVSDAGDDVIDNQIYVVAERDEDVDIGLISSGTGLEARLVPSSFLTGERQIVDVVGKSTSVSSTRTRVAEAQYEAGKIVIMMPLLGDEIVTDLGATGAFVRWTDLNLAPTDRVSFYMDDGRNLVLADATAGWVASHNSDRIELDQSLPGFDPNWRITIPEDVYFEWTRVTHGLVSFTAIERPGVAVNPRAHASAKRMRLGDEVGVLERHIR